MKSACNAVLPVLCGCLFLIEARENKPTDQFWAGVFSALKQGRTKGESCIFSDRFFPGLEKLFPRSGECAWNKRTRPILERISLQAEKIKTAVNQIITTEKAVSDLPISLRLKFTHWQTGLKIVKWNGLLYFVLLWNLIKKGKTGVANIFGYRFGYLSIFLITENLVFMRLSRQDLISAASTITSFKAV